MPCRSPLAVRSLAGTDCAHLLCKNKNKNLKPGIRPSGIRNRFTVFSISFPLMGFDCFFPPDTLCTVASFRAGPLAPSLTLFRPQRFIFFLLPLFSFLSSFNTLLCCLMVSRTRVRMHSALPVLRMRALRRLSNW